MIQSAIPHRAAPLGTYWHLTTTTLPKTKEREQQWTRCMLELEILCLCRAAITIYSGCSSILLLQFNSCPLIYIPNLATIKIPELLVNSVSLFSSTSHPWFVSSDSSAMWCKWLVNTSKYVWGEHGLCPLWAQRPRFVCREPDAHWGSN